MSTEAKVKAFIKKHGITVCPPMAAIDMAPAKPKRVAIIRECLKSSKSPEHDLAIAKLVVMFESLGGRPRSGEKAAREKLINDARCFFFGDSDLEEWCIAADLDPEYVREKARKIAKEGVPRMRAAPGNGKEYEKRKGYRERNQSK